MASTPATSPGDPMRLLPSTTTVAQARELVPRRTYGVVVDEKGRPLTCLYALERYSRWPAEATLAAMSASWPGLITLPAAEAVDDRRVALYLWDELTAQPNVPAVVLVGAQGRPVGVLSRFRLNSAVPELAPVVFEKSLDGRDGPAGTLIQRELVTRYGSLQMPGRVQLRQPCALKIAITRESSAVSQGQVELALRARSWPLHVVARLVNVRSEDFVLDGPDFLAVEVPKDEDSAVHEFRLVPQSLGEKTVRVQFWHSNRFVAETKVTTTVVADQPAAPGDARVAHPPVLAYAGPPPDFTLCVKWVDGRRYSVHVARASDDPRLPPRLVGEIEFEDDPKAYMQRIYGKLNSRAKQAHGAAELLDGLGIEGDNLYRHLFADQEIKDFYWQEMRAAAEPVGPDASRNGVPVVQIVSDDPYTAWELVRAWRRPESGMPDSDPLHFCERFALTRWLSDAPGPSADLPLRKIVVVAPPSNLAYVQAEVDALRALAARAGLACEMIQTKAELVQLLRQGEADVLHFACHGKFDLQEAQSSLIVLGNETMEASEIVGSWIGWNGRQGGRKPVRPLVFLNVCDSAQVGLGLTGLDGWAERFLTDADAGFFIGSIWKTNDELACEFARGFYDRLFAGTPVAEALRQARETVKEERVRRKKPGDATYLTYSVFANPQVTVSVLPRGEGG